jgi:S1-C subfamily serine protease
MSTDLSAFSGALEAIVTGAAPSVVSVASHRQRSSGFVWKPGLIVTSDEGLADEGEVRVTLPGGESTTAELVGRDPSTAIALLRIARTDLVPLRTTTAAPGAGALVLAIGAEDGAPTAAFGAVAVSSGPWQSIRGGEIDARLELGLRLRRTAEGGAALNAAGEAFGMTVFGPRRRTLVIPAATIDRIAAQLEAHGRIARGYLGLGLQPVAVAGGGAGVMVISVDPNGPGVAANIHQGDVLVSIDGKPFGRLRSLLRSLGPDSVGKSVAIELKRGGQTQKTTLQIGERPAA